MKKTLGGDRLGSGKRMQVELHGYERSTHNMGYIWRSTMAPGTLVPFMKELALPGDTFDIDLDCNVMTHPTTGPLFGSYKVQLDIFQCPLRLYQGKLHNNKLGIGLNMAQVKLPTMTLYARGGGFDNQPDDFDYDNYSVNPSCILAYLGIRGVGFNSVDNPTIARGREFNAVPLLAYWDIYKNYYSNKQEDIGFVIHRGAVSPETVDTIKFNNVIIGNGTVNVLGFDEVDVNYSGATPDLNAINIQTNIGTLSLGSYFIFNSDNGVTISGQWNFGRSGAISVYGWSYNNGSISGSPTPVPFALGNLDQAREDILDNTSLQSAFDVNDLNYAPYNWILSGNQLNQTYVNNQEGLAIKTYNSDLFNNWLNTETINGVNGISEVTSIDTSGGSFTIDTLNLSKKVYNMLNRIAVSGGTYDDWLDAVYTHERYLRAETPIYCGGMSRELAFQEVVNNSASNAVQGGMNASQPLGTLAGKGVLTKGQKGGSITVKVDEPSYIMGIVSITPRIDYSQGNKWDVHLQTMDDLHKPALDEIGFQDLITEQMAWWDTYWNGSEWVQKSAGKQPAWINYMTNVNQVYGNFAIKDNEMFMTLNRRYEWDTSLDTIKDLTTYIDPTKYNNIFAEGSIDAQNFWVQISNDIIARRKMSAKIMPNL
jgi:hypothetical protein